MTNKKTITLALAVALLATTVPAQALVIDDQTDIVRWQYENPGKRSAKHRLADAVARPLLEYTHAEGPIHIQTTFGRRLDDRCAVVEVTYHIQGTLRRDGQRVTYSQVVPVPFCKDGGAYAGHLARPDTSGFYAEQEAADAAGKILKGSK